MLHVDGGSFRKICAAFVFVPALAAAQPNNDSERFLPAWSLAALAGEAVVAAPPTGEHPCARNAICLATNDWVRAAV
ncbi:hypothetical protein K438DRAFT_355798 [Mycena galopus ATCC 62051]|nr:hypothetical protein K438DRAFT_355798 [Mycena galopus ATCC 62051]